MDVRAYFRRLREKMVHDPLPPEDIAAGWALGVFVGCAVPFGLQLIISIPLAMMMRVSKIGATLGTFITNPVSIFFIYPAQTFVVNRLLFGGSLTYSKLANIVLPRGLSPGDSPHAHRLLRREARGGPLPRVARQAQGADAGERGRRVISPETIAQIRALMEEASVFEEDLDESFILGGGPGGQKTNKTSNVVRLSHEPSALSVRCGETRSRETNRWLARRMLAELILERERGRKSAARQAAEKIRRQKRRRSRRQKQKMLADKHAHSEVKRLRRPVAADE